ncbi:hypothetical protein [Kitasatospora indigofera]|uniref:hypothetical protein n=1 Tax=Kitasatospora indigofera TaxID=67307 RepID=UPI001E6082F8|nr:hypothetical protein [Kitasatospora indigofera]
MFGNFDTSEAVIEWESIFTGRSFEELVEADEPVVIADLDDGDGPTVFVASEALRHALAAADGAEPAEAGALWVQELAAEGAEFDLEIATGILGEPARPARGIDGRTTASTAGRPGAPAVELDPAAPRLRP